MATIMLPFSIDTNKVKGGNIYRFKRIVENGDIWSVRVTRIQTAQIGANTPYLVMPTETTLTFDDGATFNTTTEPTESLTDGAWEFKGVYAYTIFKNHPDLGRVYNFAAQERNGTKVGQFVETTADDVMPALNAYLVKNQNVALAKSRVGSLGYSLPTEVEVQIVDENDNVVETGMMNTVTGQVRLNGWYDMNGRKLNAKPTARGNYYHNGKRIFVK